MEEKAILFQVRRVPRRGRQGEKWNGVETAPFIAHSSDFKL